MPKQPRYCGCFFLLSQKCQIQVNFWSKNFELVNLFGHVNIDKMAQIDVEEKGGDSPERGNNPKNNNSKLWIIAVIVILAIIVAWISLSDRNRADVETPPEPVVLKDKTGTRHLM